MKVMATGTFDILHPGHGVYLEESRKLDGRKKLTGRKIRQVLAGEAWTAE